MIGKDYCRCPGCGQCDAAEEVERLREVLVRIGNEARDLKTVKANGSRRPRTRRGWVMTRAELIAMLERAEGPSRELDEDIARHCGWKTKESQHFGTMWQAPTSGGWYRDNDTPPWFTSSIDAALTLLEEQESVSIEIWTGSDGHRYSRITVGEHDSGTVEGTARALVIAALSARKEAT